MNDRQYKVKKRKRKSKAKPVPFNLPILLNSDVPFSVVYANSLLGAQYFFLLLERDFNRVDLVDFEPEKNGLRAKLLSATDRLLFEEIRRSRDWQKISLGSDGDAWELKKRPFQTYYRNAKLAKELTPKRDLKLELV